MSLGFLLLFSATVWQPAAQASYELARVNFLDYNIIHGCGATMLGLRWCLYPTTVYIPLSHPLGSNKFLSPTLLFFKNSRWRPRSTFRARPLKYDSTAGHCLVEVVNNCLTEFFGDKKSVYQSSQAARLIQEKIVRICMGIPIIEQGIVL